MYRLVTFGPPALVGPDGPVPLSKQRLAVLAVLAASGDAGLSRERLLLLFWGADGGPGDARTAAARHALEQLLSALRKGVDAALFAGPNPVRLDAAALPSDVVAFGAAVRAGDHARALALYAGPFLDGLRLGRDAARFDDWADEERARLAARAAAMAEAAVAAATTAGDHRAAADVARRWAGWDPVDSRAALGLMRTLAAGGDAAGALAHARRYEAVCRGDADAAADPRVAAYASHLRTRTPSDPAPRAPSDHGRAASGRAEAPPAAESVPESVPAPALGTGAREPGVAPGAATAANAASAATRPGGRPRPRWPRRAAFAAAGLVAAVALVAGGRAIATGRPGAPAARPAAPPAGPPRLAVLPFKSLGPPGDQSLADGVTEEVTARLARVAGLGVISRTSADQYRATTKPLRQVARELGVDYVLEGRVQWARGPDGTPARVRVTPELIRVADDTHLWADRYDAPAADVFRVQGDVAERVAAALAVRLTAPERRTLAAAPTTNLRAYELYLRAAERGRAVSSDRAAYERVIALYGQAIALDSAFALAYAGRAIMYRKLYIITIEAGERPARLARADAERAVRLDPALPDAYVALGDYYYWGARNLDSAAAAFDAALRLEPNHAGALGYRAAVLALRGRPDEALALDRRAADLDPRSAVVQARLATQYLFRRDYRRAVEYSDRTVALEPDVPGYRLSRAVIEYRLRGDTAAFRVRFRAAVAAFGAARVVPILFVGPEGAGLLAALDPAEVDALDRAASPSLRANPLSYRDWKFMVAQAIGPPGRVRAEADSVRVFAEQRAAQVPNHPMYPCLLSVAYARLGRAADAERAIRRCDALKARATGLGYAAHAYTILGQQDAAVRTIRALLAQPSFLTVPMLRLDPAWRPLRGHPEFDRLVASAPP